MSKKPHHVKLSGNAHAGWVGEVHTGDQLVVVSPEGATHEEALSNLLAKVGEITKETWALTEEEAAKVIAAAKAAWDSVKHTVVGDGADAQAPDRLADDGAPHPAAES